MINIKCIKHEFINNNDTLELNIEYNEDKLSSSFNIDNKIIKRTMVNCIIQGNCNVDGNIYCFKSSINFLIINNEVNIFLSNISINQVAITDDEYNDIPDISEDDYVEHLIYDSIKQIFLSSNFTKISNSSKNKYNINFKISKNNSINEKDITFNILSSDFTFGVFS